MPLSVLPVPRARRSVRPGHLVGAALVATLLVAYCAVLLASVRRAAGLRLAESSILQERMACEKLPRASDRWACSRVALRGLSAEPVLAP